MALSLLPLLSGHPHVVLLDPPLELSPGNVPHHQNFLAKSVTQIVTIEQTAAAQPKWQTRDVISQVTGKLLCDEEVVNAIFDVSRFPCPFYLNLCRQYTIISKTQIGHTQTGSLRILSSPQ